VIEAEKNDKKIRVLTYIKSTILYTRRTDIESPNLHLIILDIKNGDNLRIITLTEPSTHKIKSRREHSLESN
jgi:hypothetical protein